MLEGSFEHEDFCGHRGTINPGDLQVRIVLFPLVPIRDTFNSVRVRVKVHSIVLGLELGLRCIQYCSG